MSLPQTIIEDIYIYIYTSRTLVPFSETDPASLHSCLRFEGLATVPLGYRIAVSGGGIRAISLREKTNLGVNCYCV